MQRGEFSSRLAFIFAASGADQLAGQLAAARISVKPAPLFSAQSDLYQDYFRIGFGEQKMPQALSALIEFVEKNRSHWQATAYER